MIGSPYRRHERDGIWERDGYEPVAYSDGTATEERLLRAVQACRDRSSFSRELRASMVDWPSEYHFSAARGNIVRALDIGADQSVLELGSGCGAVTRAFGETGAAVLAVEGSRRRAAITASRCADLQNVVVACDSIAAVQPAQRFDWVTLIGVLEYAPVYFGGSDPVGQCLAAAMRHLRPDGKLVIAIENRLGLKYFAGCAEDHLGEEFYGIEARYRAGTPRTFGRLELRQELERAGLHHLEWLFPFPDYKLASVVIHEAAFAAPDFNVADLMVRAQSRDYRGSLVRAFDETLAWPGVVSNGLGQDLANSFLVIGRRAAAPVPRQDPWLARAYAITRRPEYAVRTQLGIAASGPCVERSRLAPGVKAAGASPLHHRPQAEPYVRGTLVATQLIRAAGRELNLDAVAAAARPWLDFLMANVAARGPDPLDALLPGRYVDCTPYNTIMSAEGVCYIDQEWEWGEPVPVAWVVVRGLAHTFHRATLSEAHAGLTLGELVVAVGGRLGLAIDSRHLVEAASLEDRLLAEVFDEPAGAFRQLLDRPLDRHVPAFAYAARALQLGSDLDLAHAEIRRVKRTVSWRLTKPLRLAWNLLTGRLFRTQRA